MQAQNKKICITIDDLPTMNYSVNTPEYDLEITSNLINTFKKYDIPAIGFVCEKQLYKNEKLDSNKVRILEMWVESGCDLGNHSFSHFDYNATEDSVYFADIAKGAEVTSSVLKKYGKAMKYFRHPYLRKGITQEKFHALQTYLATGGYTEAPVTIDNDDYLFAKSYHNAYIAKNALLMKEIGELYVKYMEDKLLYFEKKGVEVFGSVITQSLLIHASLLNSHYLDDLSRMFKKHGYIFVSQSEALSDPAYSSPDTFVTRHGISWIFRWGLSKGMPETLMDGDVETPEKIVKLASE